MGLVLRQIAFVVLCAQRRAIAIGVGDISKEELAGGTDFDLKIVVRVAIKGRDEDLNHIFLIERIIAVLVSGDDFLIDAAPVNEEASGVMADGGSCGVVERPVNEREMQHDRRQRAAARHIEGNCKLQNDEGKEIFHNKIRIISFGNRNNTASWGNFHCAERKIGRNCEGKRGDG